MQEDDKKGPDSFVRITAAQFHADPGDAMRRSETQRVVVCDERGETRLIIYPPWRADDDY